MNNEGEILLNKKVEAFLVLVGNELVKEAKRFCPVGQYEDGRVGGRLRGSITFATNKTKSEVEPKGTPPASESDAIKSPTESLVVRVGTAVEYGPYVEYGTSKMGNTPFLRAALRTAKIDRLKKLAGFK